MPVLNRRVLPASPRRESGIALITAMLVVSIAVIAATAVLSSGSLAIQRTATLQETEKALWYAAGVEVWVKTILQLDAKQNQYDALTDIWAQPVDFLPVEQGFLSGRVVDLQGRFNLNNFGVVDPNVFLDWQKIFGRLFVQLKLDPGLAIPLSEAIRDWVDSDQTATPYDGAEDAFYLAARPPLVPYRTPDQLMQSVSELMAVRGMTKEIYQALLPYISALPMTDTPINVNTAPAPVVLALMDTPTSAMEQFLQSRVQTPAQTLAQLTTLQVIQGARAASYDVYSRFFQLRATASIGNSRVAIYSLFYRPLQGTPVVLARSTDSE